jgi:hypothetical protein|nr:MAG TPA: hypothetical protein [Caudoviricetes sp.]
MTYIKFKKEIEKMRLVCDYSFYFVSVYYPTHSSYPLAYVSQQTLNRMTTTLDISQLPEDVGNKVITLCCELATTPLDKRQTVVLD